MDTPNRDELPEGWGIWVMRLPWGGKPSYVAYRLRGHGETAVSRADAIAAAWRIVDAEKENINGAT